MTVFHIQPWQEIKGCIPNNNCSHEKTLNAVKGCNKNNSKHAVFNNVRVIKHKMMMMICWKALAINYVPCWS